MADDRYAKFDYSRLISWDDRLRREWPFLEEILAGAPSRSVLDLGSGTGEHARFLASKGFQVTGIDASPAMVDKSRSSGETEGVKFLQGDMRHPESILHERHGAALCLGNALPHLAGDGDLSDLARGLRTVLLPGAPVIVQLLNYARFEAKRERALPLSFLPDPDDPKASILFLRVMDLRPGHHVVFMPTTLRVRPDADPPIELVASQRVEIRSWRLEEIRAVFEAAGFKTVEAYGSYQKAPFEPAESRDLIVVAR